MVIKMEQDPSTTKKPKVIIKQNTKKRDIEQATADRVGKVTTNQNKKYIGSDVGGKNPFVFESFADEWKYV